MTVYIIIINKYFTLKNIVVYLPRVSYLSACENFPCSIIRHEKTCPGHGVRFRTWRNGNKKRFKKKLCIIKLFA